MTAISLITMRETLEASLVVGITLAYLRCTQNQRFNPIVWLGVLGGMILSLILAIVFRVFFGGFTGVAEQVYEGVMMLVGASLLTWMILWMLRTRRTIKQDIEREVGDHVREEHTLGLFMLILVSVAREGIETVIFLQAAVVHSGGYLHVFGGFLGIAVAVIFSYLLFRGIVILSVRHVFTVTSILLIFFAAGLVAHGIHEFQEAGIFPVGIEHVWDINPVVVTEGSFPALHENGMIGEILKGLFGYNGNPSLVEIVAYVAYLSGIGMLWKRMAQAK